MERYLKENDKAIYVTTKLKMDFLAKFHQKSSEIKTREFLTDYLKDLIYENFEYVYDETNIAENADDFYENREPDSINSFLVKSLLDEFKNNFVFEIGKFYQDNTVWYRQILTFFNEFLNKQLSLFESKYRVNALFFNQDSSFMISLVIYKYSKYTKFSGMETYNYEQKVTKNHNKKIEELGFYNEGLYE